MKSLNFLESLLYILIMYVILGAVTDILIYYNTDPVTNTIIYFFTFVFYFGLRFYIDSRESDTICDSYLNGKLYTDQDSVTDPNNPKP